MGQDGAAERSGFSKLLVGDARILQVGTVQVGPAQVCFAQKSFAQVGANQVSTDYSVIGGEGWEEVADYALEWAEANATRPAA
jgi:hypothetical protein